MMDDNDEKKPLLSDSSPSDAEETVELHINSIKCAGCAGKLEKVLNSTPGVTEYSVVVFNKNVYFKYQKNITTAESIIEKLKKLHSEIIIISKNKKDSASFYFKYSSENLDTEWTKKINGCEFIFIKSDRNFYFFKAEFSKKTVGIRKVEKFLRNKLQDFEIVDCSDIFPLSHDSDVNYWLKMFSISLIFGILTMTLMILEIVWPIINYYKIGPKLSFNNLALFISCTIVQVIVGKPLYISAFNSIKSGVNMDFLISTATSISYIYSCAILVLSLIDESSTSPHTFFDTPPMLYMIVSLGRYIESRGKKHTINSIKGLMKPIRQIIEIEVKDSNSYKTERIDSILIQDGDIVNILQGQRIPADGLVFKVKDFAMINESLLTGESLPVNKKINDKVFCGSINEGNPFQMLVTSTGDDCRIQQITKSVQNTLMNKIKFNNIVDVVSRNFVPYILLLSILTFVAWMTCFTVYPNLDDKLNIRSPIEFSFKAAISVLCVACPCAIGLAIPLAIMISTGVATKYGIYIKGGPPLQILSRVTRIIFDKTGTITRGEPQVENFKIYTNDMTENEIETNKNAILYLTSSSNHLLSKGINSYLSKNKNSSFATNIFNYEEITGFGLKGNFSFGEIKKQLVVGKEELFPRNGILVDEYIKKDAQKLSTGGASVVFVSVDDTIFGFFVIRDQIRPDAQYTIHHLKQMNISPVMLTGDRKECALYVAKQVGISEIYYNRDPEEKSEIIEYFCKSKEEIAMVGDGVNDIIAMANSSVSIAIGNSMDITTETANVVIMNNKIHSILNLIILSKMTMYTIKRNLVFSFVYNLLAVPIAAGCLKWTGFDVQPWIAAIAMVLSSLSVTFSSMIILTFKLPYDGLN